MAITWIDLSTRWSLASVQAALNVIISVLATVGIWSFSRFWWQRAGTRVVRDNSEVPLSTLYTVGAPGDGWDAIVVLGRRLLKRESWHLLLQIIFIITLTLASMLSGPIASASSRLSRTIQKTTLEVLQTVKPPGSSDNLLNALVLWNDTIESLNQASFPYDQLLDYLPPSTKNWTYVASEWDPTWSMKCNFTSETVLHNVTGDGNFTMYYDPIDAFPAYRDSYDPSWLNQSKYRNSTSFISWTAGDGEDAPFTDALFFILIESDPAVDNRWDSNNETMELSLSVLHAQNFTALGNQWFNYADHTEWAPTGPVGNASYARVECTIARKPKVLNESLIPWVWTNDTYSIAAEMATNWQYPFEVVENVNNTYPTPTAEELLRFYQVYILTVGTTFDLSPTPKEISVWMDTVQLSVFFLAFIIISTVLILWLCGLFLIFIIKHKSKLSDTSVPDSRMDWMIYTSKIAADATDEEQSNDREKVKDRDYFQAATFGFSSSEVNSLDGDARRPSLARVYSSRSSISGGLPINTRGSKSGPQGLRTAPTIHESKEAALDSNDTENHLNLSPSSSDEKKPEFRVSFMNEGPGASSPVPNPFSDAKQWNSKISRMTSSKQSPTLGNRDRHSPQSSIRSAVLENDKLSPMDTAACASKGQDLKEEPPTTTPTSGSVTELDVVGSTSTKIGSEDGEESC